MPTDGLKKRWFVEELVPSLKNKMKVVLPASYTDAYNRTMDIKSENKASRGKKRTSDDDSMDGSSNYMQDRKVVYWFAALETEFACCLGK